jgi:hypothetical protein
MLCLSHAHAADHVLTITLDSYRTDAGLNALDGVQIDRQSAIVIAEKLGYDTSRIVQVKNEQATSAGIRSALSRLEQELEPGDRAFVYFSGHGGSVQVDGVCQSSLVTYEGDDYLSSEFAASLSRIKAKTPGKVFVLFDSCHAGELTERVARAKGSFSLRPKFRARTRGGDAPCKAPINFGQQAMPPKSKGTFNENMAGDRLVMLSAARENEVAWDGASGGVATRATAQCLSEGGLQSTDGSGFISAESLRQCAQSKLDVSQSDSTRQHIVAYGRALDPLAVAPSSGSSAKSDAVATLTAIASQSDPSWKVRIEPYVGERRRDQVSQAYQWSDRQRIRIGSKEHIELTAQSDRSGYLYLLYASRDSNCYELLYPKSVAAQDNWISANTPYRVPERWPALGNEGKPDQDTILAIVSDQPMPALMDQFKHGGQCNANASVAMNVAAAVTLPCKSLGPGESTCKAGPPRKLLGRGESTAAGDEKRYGAAGVVLDEY